MSNLAFVEEPKVLDEGVSKEENQPSTKTCWTGVLGRGCDEAEISEEKRLFTE